MALRAQWFSHILNIHLFFEELPDCQTIYQYLSSICVGQSALYRTKTQMKDKTDCRSLNKHVLSILDLETEALLEDAGQREREMWSGLRTFGCDVAGHPDRRTCPSPLK